MCSHTVAGPTQVAGGSSVFRLIEGCRICGNRSLAPILSLGNQYLTGVFPRSAAEQVPCGPLDLVRCDNLAQPAACGLVQLRQTYEAKVLYGQNYGYRSSLNQEMVEH